MKIKFDNKVNMWDDEHITIDDIIDSVDWYKFFFRVLPVLIWFWLFLYSHDIVYIIIFYLSLIYYKIHEN